jgi:hypothetical protein
MYIIDTNGNLEVPRGDSAEIPISCKKDDGSPIDITGYEIYFSVKGDLDDPDTSIVMQSITDTHVDALNGITGITLTADQTKIEPGRYHAEIKIKKDVDKRDRVWNGYLTIRNVVTLED